MANIAGAMKKDMEKLNKMKNEKTGSNSALSDVLFALREEYEWLVEENKAMEENPDNYPEVDHYGLPYCKKVLESIAKKANVELVSK